ncbi:Uncharacterised protein [Serratia rubidaea]|nr:Uncharacterised protein [Serratia rubidaea]
MTFTMLKRYGVTMLLAVGANASAADQRTAPESGRLQTILTINAQAPIADLNRATASLKAQFEQHADYSVGKMFYGYGQLFIATDFLKKKNYLRAAESSKLGFFYIDEAAETDDGDWRLRFLRARMDAFVPASNGRCVVAVKDTDYLQQSASLPAPLRPMVTLMSARALETCKQQEKAAAAWTALGRQGEEGQRLLALRNQPAPAWAPAELSLVIRPLTEGAL